MDICLVLAIILVINLLVLSNIKPINLDHFYYVSDYLYYQTKSMYGERINYQYVSFNEQGNVNRARTIKINNHQITIGLGVGRLEFKE